MKKIFLILFGLIISTLTMAQDESNAVCPIKVGQEIPDSRLLNIDADTVALADVIGKEKVVLVFFRGGWCPYCTSHLKGLQKVKSQIDSLGYKMIAITVDNVQNASKVVDKKKLDYELYSDIDGTTIDNFGISFQLPEKTLKKYKNVYKLDLEKKSVGGHTKLPVPSVFIIEKKQIKFEYVNPDYSQRLDPKLLVKLLED